MKSAVPLGATKERILERLARAPAAAEELAGELGLSRVAVQRHLKDLWEWGLLAFEERKNGGPGRPKRLWRRVDGEAPYYGLCENLLQELRRELGPDGLAEVVARAQAERLAAALAARPSQGRLAALVAHLRQGDYQSALEGGGAWVQRRCPRLALARKFPELCRAEARAYARVLGRPVRILERIAEGGEVCRFVLED